MAHQNARPQLEIDECADIYMDIKSSYLTGRASPGICGIYTYMLFTEMQPIRKNSTYHWYVCALYYIL